MASNYSSDPDNACITDPVAPQGGSGGKMSASALPPEAQAALPSTPPSVQGVQFAAANFSPGAGGKQHRLAPGTSLSGGRYRIERLVASGGMGAVYRAIDQRFSRP